MITLRPYQQASIDALYKYFREHDGNPLVVLPTGAGKSLVLAAFIHKAMSDYPDTRVIVLTHVKELIQQDAQALFRYWPEAPVGVWSAGLGKKTRDKITVAGIQSIHKYPTKFAGTHLVIIDEAHLLSKNSDTMYGRFIDGLRKFNPAVKIIGLTATPYRMDSGLLTQGKHRVFTDIAYEANVAELIKAGYLCPLVSKNGQTKADLSGVHVRGGEFVAGELQDAMNREHLIHGAFDEVEALAADRRHILGFCAGVEHAEACARIARARGWNADYVTGDMSAADRDARIAAFKDGRTRMLFNAMLLTTGFDAPHIDCILMLRPTHSTGLYVQIMGRGLRIHESKTETLVLDFAGNVERHGPIDMIKVKGKAEKGEGVSVAPVKECPDCHALLPTAVRECPECGHAFPAQEAAPHTTTAADLDIIAALAKPRTYDVDHVTYARHGKLGKPDSLKVTYHCGISDFQEWLPIEDSHVKKHAIKWFWNHGWMCPETVTEALQKLKAAPIPAPKQITVKQRGKYWDVIATTPATDAFRARLVTVLE